MTQKILAAIMALQTIVLVAIWVLLLIHATEEPVTVTVTPLITTTVPTVSPSPPPNTTLRILQWKHFTKGFDNWFRDEFATKWAQSQGIKVEVELIDITDLPNNPDDINAGYDLIGLLASPADFEEYVDTKALDELHEEVKRLGIGEQSDICYQSTYNPHTKHYYGFCHGWTPDPGLVRQSLWGNVGLPEGPKSYDQLRTFGPQIKEQTGQYVGLGFAEEDIDSNMAIRAIMWAYGASVQDEEQNVVINSEETIEAVEYMADLYKNVLFEGSLNKETWNSRSNNQCFISDRCSYILNSISAYRDAVADPTASQVANDIILTAPLRASAEIEPKVAAHVYHIYIIPKEAANSEYAKQFLLHLVENYAQVTEHSQLYNLPAWPESVPDLNRWLENDPFNSAQANNLAILKDAENWSVNIGYPGPDNAAIAQVLREDILIKMVAAVARGDKKPKEAVMDAEGEIEQLYETWRAKGLIE